MMKRRNPHRMAKRHLQQFLSIAVREAENDREICGVIVDSSWMLELVRLPNRTQRRGGFRLLEEDWKPVAHSARRLGHRIVGSFHSHPAYLAKPGTGDIQGAEIGSLMLVIDCIGREAGLWRIGRNRRAYSLRLELV